MTTTETIRVTRTAAGPILAVELGKYGTGRAVTGAQLTLIRGPCPVRRRVPWQPAYFSCPEPVSSTRMLN
jgi:hypothetical protein